MKLISDDILVDTGAEDPVNDMIYPMIETRFQLWNPNSWTKGHPYELYEQMRTTSPVMWSRMERGGSGFWSVSRYDDIKTVELAPDVFSSARGGINIAVADRKHWRPEVLVRAAMDNLISMDEGGFRGQGTLGLVKAGDPAVGAEEITT